MSNIDNMVDEMLLGDYKKVKLVEKASDLVDVILDDCGEDHSKKKKEVKEVVNKIDHVPEESTEELKGDIKDELGKDDKQVQEDDKIENAIDHVPTQDADEMTSSLEDEMSKEQEAKTESAVDLVKKAFKDVKEGDITLDNLEVDETNPVYLVAKAFAEVKEGWGDVAQGALGSVNQAVQAGSRNKRITALQQKIGAAKKELAKCGDSKWCKVKKHAKLMALNNELHELRKRRGY